MQYAMHGQMQEVVQEWLAGCVRLALRHAIRDRYIAQMAGTGRRRKREHVRWLVLAAVLPIERSKALIVAQQNGYFRTGSSRRNGLESKPCGALYLFCQIGCNRVPSCIFDNDLDLGQRMTR
jgi:hypothetical protein